MSGATTNHLLNAMDIDNTNKEIKNIVLVSGQNELNHNVSAEEFICIMKKKQDRLVEMANDKKVMIIAPPPHVTAISPMDKAKDAIMRDQLTTLDTYDNISVYANPIQLFEEDGGTHPSPDQTKLLIQYIDEKTKEIFGSPYTLPGAVEELLVTKRKYSGVTPLYKYGCGACNNRTRNKWFSLCSSCKGEIDNEENLRNCIDKFHKYVERFTNIELPTLEQSSSQLSTSRDRSPIKSSQDDNDNNEKKRRPFFMENILKST